MSDTPMIYAAICRVMEDIGAVGKGDYNKQQGFKYRGIDAVMNALSPSMIKNKVFCTPEVLEQSREERVTKNGGNLIYSVCRMRYRFFTEDGSYVDAIVVGEGMDSGDKASNKAMAVAFKYACFQTFCIPTENLMDDPDKETPLESTKVKQSGENGPEKTQPDEDKLSKEVDKLAEGVRLKPVYDELQRVGYSVMSICKTYKLNKISDISDLQIKDFLAKVKNMPDKESA